jgi:hypothetical protein
MLQWGHMAIWLVLPVSYIKLCLGQSTNHDFAALLIIGSHSSQLLFNKFMVAYANGFVILGLGQSSCSFLVVLLYHFTDFTLICGSAHCTNNISEIRFESI